MAISYRDAGVDIDAGDELVERIKPLAKRTRIPGVLADVVGFAGLFAVPSDVEEPVLVSGTHQESIASIPATGRRLTVHALLYCELDPPGERLWRVRAFFDAYDAAIQLGVMPERGSIGEKAILLVRGFGLRRQGGDEVERRG